MNLGEKIIDFNLFGVDDSYFSVDSIDNEKKIVVFFTCNHCPYVKAIANRLKKDADELQKHSINTIAIMSVSYTHLTLPTKRIV